MGPGAACETMSLDYPGKTLALASHRAAYGSNRDVDLLASGEYVGAQPVSNLRHVSVRLYLVQVTEARHRQSLDMAALRLVQLTGLREANLHGSVPISLGGLDLRDIVRTHLEHGHRDRLTRFSKDLRHPKFSAQKSVNTHLSSLL
jgi:hypothetical protein